MACNQNWSEENMIDFILGNLSVNKASEFRLHLDTCMDCQQKYGEWKGILSDADDSSVHPPASIKKRVMKKVKRRFLLPKLNPKVVAASIATTFVIAFSAMFFLNQYHQNQEIDFSHQTETQPMFVMAPDTSIYELVPEVRKEIKGYAWINGKTKEIYLLVDGMNPVSNKDYQAWIKTPYQLKDAGTFQLLNGKGQLYFKDGGLHHIQYILVSIEPKGGSNTPTDPNAFLIRLHSSK